MIDFPTPPCARTREFSSRNLKKLPPFRRSLHVQPIIGISPPPGSQGLVSKKLYCEQSLIFLLSHNRLRAGVRGVHKFTFCSPRVSLGKKGGRFRYTLLQCQLDKKASQSTQRILELYGTTGKILFTWAGWGNGCVSKHNEIMPDSTSTYLQRKPPPVFAS